MVPTGGDYNWQSIPTTYVNSGSDRSCGMTAYLGCYINAFPPTANAQLYFAVQRSTGNSWTLWYPSLTLQYRKNGGSWTAIANCNASQNTHHTYTTSTAKFFMCSATYFGSGRPVSSGYATGVVRATPATPYTTIEMRVIAYGSNENPTLLYEGSGKGYYKLGTDIKSWEFGGGPRIYSGGWKTTIPYVYSGGWKMAMAYVYSGGWKICG